jgi:hypothetical protein
VNIRKESGNDMDHNYNCSILDCDSIEAELEMRKKYKLLKLHWTHYSVDHRGDERIEIGGIPIIFDHQKQEIILNSEIEDWQLENVCDYLVQEGYIDK